MSGVEIPERAYEIGESAHEQAGYKAASARLRSDSAIAAAAPIIVAAELRRLVPAMACVGDKTLLSMLVDELDPEGETQ